MKNKAFKTAIILVEFAALAITIFAAALLFLYWRMGQGPVSLSLFKQSAEHAIERQLPAGFDAGIQSIHMQRTDGGGTLLLRMTDTKILDADGNPAADAPELLFTFHLQDLMKGEIGPRSAVADAARFRIVRHENLKVEIPIARAEKKQRRSLPVVSSFIDGSLLKSAFESAEIKNAEIIFYDVASARSWSTKNAHVDVNRNSDGLVAHAAGEIDMDGVRAALDANAIYRASDGVIDVVVAGERFPIGDLLSTFYGDDAAILDAPVSGEANISFTVDGDVLASRFDARIGKGALTIGGQRRAISSIAWVTAFDPDHNRFSIENLVFDTEGARGEIAGGVSISFGDNIRRPERISFDLKSDAIEITAPEWLEAPLMFEHNELAGQYLLRERRLSLETLRTDVEGLSAAGFVSLQLPRATNGNAAPSAGVIANLSFDGALDPERLLRIWPKKLAMGARDWVVDRLTTAHIDNLKFQMDLAPGAIAEDGAMPDDAMELTFDARNVSAYYVREMTPLRDGAGSGVLRGNSFKLDVKQAQVGDVVINKGEVTFPEFMPKWRPTYYRFSANGDAQAMLSILDEKPLSLLSKVNLSPTQFTGNARADVEIMRPNKRDVASEEYGYSGVATFEAMNISELIGEEQFTGAKGRVDLKTRSMTVSADAKLADAPISLKWKQNFYREDGPSEIAIAGTFDSATGDLFGVSPRQFVRGPVYFEGRAIGDLGAFQSVDVITDFGEASLSLDMIGWRKPIGVPASGTLKMRFADDNVYIDAFTIEAENNAHIDGALVFDSAGALQSATITEFALADAADLMITAERDASGVLGFTAVGPFLNAAPLIEQMLNGSGAQNEEPLPWGAGVSLNARIDRIAMRNGIEYDDGALDMRRDAQKLRALDFTAFAENGMPLRVAMSLTGAAEGPQRAIEARTSEIGDLMSGVFGVRSIAGGEGVLRLMLNADGAPGFAGELEARRLQIVNAPLLARIFSAGSLDGLANLLNGDGIEFDYAAGEFEYANGALEIDDMQARGSSVGISADGHISFGPGGEARLNGAVAPLYQLNSVLGNTPIIGDILVGKKGEGLVAFSYSVGGTAANPAVTVNPLSVLTPGIFRRIMQPQQAPAEQPEQGDE